MNKYTIDGYEKDRLVQITAKLRSVGARLTKKDKRIMLYFLEKAIQNSETGTLDAQRRLNIGG